MAETFSNIHKVCLLDNFVNKVLQKNNTLFDNNFKNLIRAKLMKHCNEIIFTVMV